MNDRWVAVKLKDIQIIRTLYNIMPNYREIIDVVDSNNNEEEENEEKDD